VRWTRSRVPTHTLEARADIELRHPNPHHQRIGRSVRGRADRIAQLKAARTSAQVAQIADRLALIGTDTTVEALAPMIDDRRPGVAESILNTIGRIATPRAVALLIQLVPGDRPRIRTSAIAALGATGSDDARGTSHDLRTLAVVLQPDRAQEPLPP
jgi:HEAT repeat protein